MSVLQSISDYRARSSTRPWHIFFGGLAVLLILWLALADKPWQIDMTGKVKLPQLVAYWLWWGGLVNLIITGGLLAMCRWWTGPLMPADFPAPKVSRPVWFWPLVLVAMIIAAWFAVPRMTFSLWDDEELSGRQAIVGKYQTDKKNGEVSFRHIRWYETVFDYRTPNNHVLHSILSRACLDTWQATLHNGGLPFAEWPMRIPALVFGIAAVGTLAWFLRENGFAAAGVSAAFLLAIHPWHLRYASEARGYSMIICLLPLIFVFWQRAIRTGSWFWWGAFAVAQFASFYSHPGMLFLLAILNVLTIPALMFSRESALPFFTQSGRWFCVNSLAAMLSIFLFLPLLPQAREYFEHEGYRGVVLGWSWIKGALSLMLNGGPWISGPGYPGINANGTVATALIVFALVVTTVGIVRFLSRGWLASCITATVLAAPLLTFGFSRMRSMMIYESYIIYVLPLLIAFAAVGIWSLCHLLRSVPTGRVLAPAAAILIISGYFAVTQGFRTWLSHNSLQQIRESVVASHRSLDPKSDGGILTASFCIPPYLYDAYMTRPDSVQEFIDVLKQADREKKTLYFNIGMPWAAREYSPSMWKLFNDPALFDSHRTFPGYDAGLDRIVARYIPGSAERYDFSGFKVDAR